MRYIKADLLKENIFAHWYTREEIYVTIDNQPTADVRENVKGEWIKEVDTMGGYDDYTPINYYCSICGYLSMDGQTNYCPNCGADMRGEV